MAKGYMYILECSDGSYYTGSTKNLEKRFREHQEGKGANHTKKRLPVKLVYFEEFTRIDEAFYREKQIQGWSRKKKEALIEDMPEKLHELAKCMNATHYAFSYSDFDSADFDSAQSPEEEGEGEAVVAFNSAQSPSDSTALDSTQLPVRKAVVAFDSAQSPRGKAVVERSRNESEKKIPQLRFKEFNSKEIEVLEYSDIYNFYPTLSLSRDKLEYSNEGFKYIHYGDIHTTFRTLFDASKENVPTIKQNNSQVTFRDELLCKTGDLIIADASEDYNDIGKSIEIVKTNNDLIIAGLHTFLARPENKKIALGFSAFLMQSNLVRTQIKK